MRQSYRPAQAQGQGRRASAVGQPDPIEAQERGNRFANQQLTGGDDSERSEPSPLAEAAASPWQLAEGPGTDEWGLLGGDPWLQQREPALDDTGQEQAGAEADPVDRLPAWAERDDPSSAVQEATRAQTPERRSTEEDAGQGLDLALPAGAITEGYLLDLVGKMLPGRGASANASLSVGLNIGLDKWGLEASVAGTIRAGVKLSYDDDEKVRATVSWGFDLTGTLEAWVLELSARYGYTSSTTAVFGSPTDFTGWLYDALYGLDKAIREAVHEAIPPGRSDAIDDFAKAPVLVAGSAQPATPTGPGRTFVKGSKDEVELSVGEDDDDGVRGLSLSANTIDRTFHRTGADGAAETREGDCREWNYAGEITYDQWRFGLDLQVVTGHLNPDNDGVYMDITLSRGIAPIEEASTIGAVTEWVGSLGAPPSDAADPAASFFEMVKGRVAGFIDARGARLGDGASSAGKGTGALQLHYVLSSSASYSGAGTHRSSAEKFGELMAGIEWGKWRMQYARVLATLSGESSAKIPLNAWLFLTSKASAGITLNAGEVIGRGTFTYLQTVFNGLKSQSGRDKALSEFGGAIDGMLSNVADKRPPFDELGIERDVKAGSAVSVADLEGVSGTDKAASSTRLYYAAALLQAGRIDEERAHEVLEQWLLVTASDAREDIAWTKAQQEVS